MRRGALSSTFGGAAVVIQAVVCVFAVGLPVFGAARMVLRSGVDSEALSRAWTLVDVGLLARTIGVAVAIGALATLLALPAAWSMRRLSARWAALLVAPMLLPNYLVYVAWGLARAPGTWLGDLLEGVREPAVWKAANLVQSVGGLSLWAWPVAAVVLGASARRVDRETLEALRLSGGSGLKRVLVVLAEMRGGIVASVAVVAMLMVGSAVPLHVAQVETYAIVVWRAMMETSEPAAVWVVASPLVVVALVGGVVLAVALQRMDDGSVGVEVDERVGRGWIAGAAGLWGVSTVVPLVLFVTSLRETSSLWRRAPAVFGGGVLVETVWVGVVVAAIGVVVMIGVAVGFSSVRGWKRRLAGVCVCVWVAAAVVPGVLVGFGVVASSYAGAMAWLGDSAAGVVCAQVARLGGVAAVAGWWLSRVESPVLRDARRVYAGDGVRAWWTASGRAQVVLGVGVFMAICLLSAHEIEATVVVGAPGGGTLAQRVLSLLHYLREEELKVAASCMMGVGLLVGIGVACMAAAGSGGLMRAGRGGAGVLLMIVLVGCGGESESGGALPGARVIGERGTISGQLYIPRAIDTDGEYLWVADKTDRIQRFDPETGGAITAWRMPSIEKGNPCGITVGPDGLIYVVDTHEFCVRAYRVEGDGRGERVATFGEYGTGEGQFIYPTDVAVVAGADGRSVDRIYVSEYGGNDRISVFDGSHRFLFSFGREGSGEGADDVQFERPQSVAWDGERGELVVVDTVNHRVGRFTAEGDLIGWIGAGGAQRGTGLGEFAYPYGLVLLSDGRALVSEFGNNRVQVVDLERGAGIATYGEVGRGVGQLATPWAVTVMGRRAYVVDTGNHRIQWFDLPRRVAQR